MCWRLEWSFLFGKSLYNPPQVWCLEQKSSELENRVLYPQTIQNRTNHPLGWFCGHFLLTWRIRDPPVSATSAPPLFFLFFSLFFLFFSFLFLCNNSVQRHSHSHSIRMSSFLKIKYSQNRSLKSATKPWNQPQNLEIRSRSLRFSSHRPSLINKSFTHFV